MAHSLAWRRSDDPRRPFAKGLLAVARGREWPVGRGGGAVHRATHMTAQMAVMTTMGNAGSTLSVAWVGRAAST